MDLKLVCYDYILLVFILTCRHGLGLLHSGSEAVSSQCDKPELINGYVELYSRGRVAVFHCNPGFQMVGECFAVCLTGEWTTWQMPVCIKSYIAERNKLAERKYSVENTSVEIATETVQMVTATASPSTSSTTSLESMPTVSTRTSSAFLSSLASTTSTLTTTSAPKYSSSKEPETSSAAKQVPQAVVTITTPKYVAEVISTDATTSTTVSSTQSPTSSTNWMRKVTVINTFTSAPTTLAVEYEPVEYNTSVVAITIPDSTASTKVKNASFPTSSSTITSTPSTKETYYTRPIAVKVYEFTEDIRQKSTTQTTVNSSGSNPTSTASTFSHLTVEVMSLSTAAFLCIAGGLAYYVGLVYYVKKQKAKQRSKLLYTSEFRYLPQNEETEYSDDSKLDKIFVM